ncbi:hypothetical protein EVAR_7482_1 [Eumeta japonica]|uniref:Uncharacterized protein n=1 Tax=Eumeta variegata TaxID=151549 RepID=A0A4C1Y2S9_EUMVA|nr:hypothetical protein EVAR_7482_1 [Eumeta japonica]
MTNLKSNLGRSRRPCLIGARAAVACDRAPRAQRGDNKGLTGAHPDLIIHNKEAIACAHPARTDGQSPRGRPPRPAPPRLSLIE